MPENITLSDKDNLPFVADTFTRDVAGTPVHMQAVVPVDPVTGEPNTATEATLSAILAAINALNLATAAIQSASEKMDATGDSQLMLLSAMLEKMPRLDRTDRLTVDMADYGIGGSSYAVSYVNGVSNPVNGATYYRTFEPWQFSDAGAARLYQQIQVN